MTNEIGRSSYRLEVAAKLDRLACDLQTANAAIIGYASSLLGGDDHAIDENAMMAIKVGGKIAQARRTSSVISRNGWKPPTRTKPGNTTRTSSWTASSKHASEARNEQRNPTVLLQ